MEKYIVIIPETSNYVISDDFDTIKEAVSYGILNNYGRGFSIAKRINYTIQES
jgi:hypothetical protein